MSEIYTQKIVDDENKKSWRREENVQSSQAAKSSASHKRGSPVKCCRGHRQLPPGAKCSVSLSLPLTCEVDQGLMKVSISDKGRAVALTCA